MHAADGSLASAFSRSADVVIDGRRSVNSLCLKLNSGGFAFREMGVGGDGFTRWRANEDVVSLCAAFVTRARCDNAILDAAARGQ